MRWQALRRELRQLIVLAVPLAAAQAGTQLMSVVDIAVLGRLGARELASAGLANAVFFALTMFGMGTIFGIDPLVSQAIGAGDRLRARFVLWQGVWLALAITVVLTIPMLLGPYVLPWFGVQADLLPMTKTYLWIRTIGLAPMLVFLVLRSYLQAQKVTRPMLVAMIAANIFNLFADILLVFGGGVLPEWCGPLRAIPAMGVAGAAIATVAGQFLQLAILIPAAKKLAPAERVDHRWNTPEVKQAFRVGLPVGLQLGAEVGVFALVGVLAASFSAVDAAVHQLVINIASFTYTVALGVAAAGSVRVGNAIGARDAAGTRLAGQAAFLGGTAFMTLAALSFAFAPEYIARLITDQPDLIAAAIPLLIVAAFFQLSDGIQAVGAGVLRGAGDTRFAFIANLLGHWLIGFPIAMILGFYRNMGVVGMWWGLCAGLTVVAVLLFVRFQRLSARAIAPLE